MTDLIPYTRLGSLVRMGRDLDELWGRFFSDDARLAWEKERTFVPSVNVKETEEAVEVTAEVPGLKPEEIEVVLSGDILTIKGEKNEEKERKDGDYHLVERRFGSFQRSFRLPVEVDRQKLSATHKDGVLKVLLPKSEKQGAATIEVRPEA